MNVFFTTSKVPFYFVLFLLLFFINILYSDVLLCDNYSQEFTLSQEDVITSDIQSNIDHTNIQDHRNDRNDFQNNFSTEPINKFHNFKDWSKRTLFWHLWKYETSQFGSYEDYTQWWDSNLEIRKEMKKDLKQDLRKMTVFKNTVSWFLHGGNRK